MAFVLSEFREGVKPITIYVGNQPVKVKIKPSAVTQTQLDKYRDAQSDQNYDEMAAIFREIVVEWDITETQDGDPVTMDGEMYEIVPTMVTSLIWDEVGKMITPKSRKKNAN